MTLFLVRHGRAATGVEAPDPGLDAVGVEQARAAAARLASSGATRLVVSPLRRTRETAEPIARALGLEPIVRSEVAEVPTPRDRGGDRHAFIADLLTSRWADVGPELAAWRRRILETLAELASAPTIVVTHFVAIGVALGDALGDDRVAPRPIANASITTFARRHGRMDLVHGPDATHLATAHVTESHAALPGQRG